MARRWYVTDLSTDPPSYTISTTWKETISIDTTAIGVSPTAASAVACELWNLATLTEMTGVTVTAAMNGDDAEILIDASTWGLSRGETYELRTELTFGAETITRITVLQVAA